MKRLIIFYFLIICINTLFSQKEKENYSAAMADRIDSAVIQQYRQVEQFFIEAYSLYPSVPRGMLEAVAYTYTRFTHRVPSDFLEDDDAVPATYGLMGLTLDGQGFFRDNLRRVSDLSGFPIEDILASPRDNVVAYAAAYAALQNKLGIFSSRFDEQLPILTDLSELPPSNDSVLTFALNSSLYAMAMFLENDRFRSAMGIAIERPDLLRCFGKQLPLLHSAKVCLQALDGSDGRSADTDYEGAVWNPAGSCNYTVGRGGHEVSAVTIHYTQGTYASAIAWFRNCTYNGVGARASAHYIVRSIDGQVTQMVREADKAWHVGNCNPYTIGIEHEAYGDIASYFTPEMYQSSASLVRDICDRNGISSHRMFYRDTLDDGTVLNSGTHSLGGESACVKIRGHQHFPNQSHTDPGPFWDWNYYYKLVNDDTPVTRFDTPSGILTDSGGPDCDYGNDERQLLLIQVDGAQSISLSFSEFDLEGNYDFLWIYDGSSVFSPLLGRWNTTSPGTVVSSGNSLLLEFRSDCATTAAGWMAAWEAVMLEDCVQPETEILWDEQQWVTCDTSITFSDMDDGDIPHRFYQIVGCSGRGWTANSNNGFVYDDFGWLDTRRWSVVRGNWRCDGGRLAQSGTVASEIGIPLRVDADACYLYEFDMAVPDGEGAERAAGILLDCSGTSARMSAYSVAVYPNENQIRVYCFQQGQRSLLQTIEGIVAAAGESCHYRVIHNVPAGRLMVFRDEQFLADIQGLATTVMNCGVRMAFFTSGTDASFDNLRVYHSRGTLVNLSVGAGDADLPWQAVNGMAMSKIRSVVVDDCWLFSDIAEKHIRVDYTPPSLREPVYGGLSECAEHSPSLLQTSFHWTAAVDSHSGIAFYEYGYVLSPLAEDDAIVWQGHTTNNSIALRSRVRLPQTYYFAVRAVNGAGLRSGPVFSGICHLGSEASALLSRSQAASTVPLQFWPNPTMGVLNVLFSEPVRSLDIFDACGQQVYERRKKECASASLSQNESREVRIDVSSFQSGMYFLRVVGQKGEIFSAKFLKQ